MITLARSASAAILRESCEREILENYCTFYPSGELKLMNWFEAQAECIYAGGVLCEGRFLADERLIWTNEDCDRRNQVRFRSMGCLNKHREMFVQNTCCGVVVEKLPCCIWAKARCLACQMGVSAEQWCQNLDRQWWPLFECV